jgi:hypothetical protein
MNDSSLSDPFYLSNGGLYYRIMLRARLLEADRYHVWRRMTVFVGVAWLPLLILSTLMDTLGGSEIGLPFLHDPGPYARYLFALPLLVLADVIIDPLLASIVLYFKKSEILGEEDQSRYDEAVLQIIRRRDSVLADVVLIALAYTLSLSVITGYGGVSLEQGVSTWLRAVTAEAHWLTPAGWWYILVSAPLLQILLYRWGWRFLIWAGFLYRVSRIRLALQPTHPDLMGGLGRVSSYQLAFGVVFVAIAVMISSALADQILFQGRTLIEFRMEIVVFVLACIVTIVAPLFFFLGQLLRAKQHGLEQYGPLGYQLSKTFHAKWIRGVSRKQKGELMNTGDASAMADYSAAYGTVSSMRLVPLNPRGTILLAATLLAPFLPLTLTKFSLAEALKRLAQMLV